MTNNQIEKLPKEVQNHGLFINFYNENGWNIRYSQRNNWEIINVIIDVSDFNFDIAVEKALNAIEILYTQKNSNKDVG